MSAVRLRSLLLTIMLFVPATSFSQDSLTAQPLDCVIAPNSTVKIGSSEEGVLSEVLVDRGDAVKRGQPVARLDSDLERLNAKLTGVRARADVDIRSRAAQLEFRERESRRVAELYAKRAVPDTDVDRAKVEETLARLSVESAKTEHRIAQVEHNRAQQLLERRSINSPVDGVVVDITLSPGEYVHEQAPLMTLAAIDPLYVEVFVPVSQFGQVSKGTQAIVMPEQPVGGEYDAEVTVVDRVFDSASRTFGVRLVLPNEKFRLPAGLRCKIRFVDSADADPHDAADAVLRGEPAKMSSAQRSSDVIDVERRRATVRVHYRSGPGVQHRRLGSFASGTEVLVEGLENGWYRILLDDGKHAYVHADYLAPATP